VREAGAAIAAVAARAKKALEIEEAQHGSMHGTGIWPSHIKWRGGLPCMRRP
jgi:hypothetical protein